MSPPQAHFVSLKEVAARAGLSVATVSYALHNDPKISTATRARVLAAAEELHYRPNPRVASLMAHIRGTQQRMAREPLAFVWVHTTRRQSREDPFLKRIFKGARERAAQVGFALEEFWTADPGMTDKRLEQILRARGIIGVVLSPVMTAETTVTLNWNWQYFAAAVIGNVSWTPELAHAGHHHYLGMRTMLFELARLGYRRPAAIIEHNTNERAKRAWTAAFLTHHEDLQAAASLIQVVQSAERPRVSDWLRKSTPDSLIVSDTSLVNLPNVRSVCRECSLPLFTLVWSEGTPRNIGGIDTCYDRVAAHAIDLVAAQLNANECGAPDLASILLFPGRWVAPEVLRRR